MTTGLSFLVDSHDDVGDVTERLIRVIMESPSLYIGGGCTSPSCQQ